MALLSPCPQLMAVVASTILGLIRNMRAFGGILVVSLRHGAGGVGGGHSVGVGLWGGELGGSTRAGGQSGPFVPDSFSLTFKSLLFSGPSALPGPSLVRGLLLPQAQGPWPGTRRQ